VVGPKTKLRRFSRRFSKSLAFWPRGDRKTHRIVGDRRLFPLLFILYTFTDVRQLHHIDHFFSKEPAAPTIGESEEVPTALTWTIARRARDRLGEFSFEAPWLNISKNDTLPAGGWLTSTYP